MAHVVLQALLLLLFVSSSTSLVGVHAAVDELNYVVVDTNSLKPNTVCSGHRVNPHGNLTANWLPLSRANGPCSAAPATVVSVVETLRWDQYRAAYIQRKLSGAAGVNGEDDKPPYTAAEISQVDNQGAVSPSVGTQGTESSQVMGINPTATGGGKLPGVTQTMVLDTASDVAWVQCSPCPVPPCHPQTDVLYDPTKSGSFAAFSCNSPTCQQLGPYANGCLNNQCQYRVQYPDGSSTQGTYISDLLTLNPTSSVSAFKFGCSHAETGSFSTKTAGIMALGGGPESLVQQTVGTFGNFFSYCFPPTTSSHGFLNLGLPRRSASRFAITPMIRNKQVPTFYLVRLTGIIVAGQQLNVPPSVFAGGSVLDTRSIFTRLPPTAYQALRAAFRDRMKMYRMAAPQGALDTCYDMTGVRSFTLPRITLVFDRNAAVELDPSGVMYQGCLAFAASFADGVPGILGNVQQQTIEVLYNVRDGAVGFRRGAC